MVYLRLYQETISKWVSTDLFWGLLDGLGHSKTPLLRADLLKTSEQEMLENDGKDNKKIKKIEHRVLRQLHTTLVVAIYTSSIQPEIKQIR